MGMLNPEQSTKQPEQPVAACFGLSTCRHTGAASTCQSALHRNARACSMPVLHTKPAGTNWPLHHKGQTHLLVCPIDERMPTKPLCPEGPRMELPVSLPREIMPKLAEAAAAGPPELPAVLRSRS